MTESEQMDDEEKLRFEEFKRKINGEAARAQVGKLEYTLTEASSDKAVIRRACQDATLLGLGAVCVLPALVKPCVSFLGTDPQVSLIACISYPHGGDSTKIKVAAVKQAIKDGIDECEVTAPISYIKDGNWNYVKREFKKLKSASKGRGIRINLESVLLTEQELVKVCNIAAAVGITALRTDSGFYGGDFDADIVSRIKAAVKDKCTVKADNVNTLTEMQTAVDMGAGVIGSKNAVDLARLILKSVEE